MQMYYIYVLRNKKNKGFYIGYTNDLQRRFQEHVKIRNVDLLYYEAFSTSKLAMDRERKLKHYGSAWRALKKRIVA